MTDFRRAGAHRQEDAVVPVDQRLEETLVREDHRMVTIARIARCASSFLFRHASSS